MKLKTITKLAAIAATAVAAQASSITYQITGDHATGGLGPPPFGTVALNEVGSAVAVTVHLNSGYSFVQTGSVDFMDFKFNAIGIALGDITVTSVNTPYTLTAATGDFHGDGTGQFWYGITGAPGQNNGAGNGFTSDIVFRVAGANIADLTQTPNVISTGENILF